MTEAELTKKVEQVTFNPAIIPFIGEAISTILGLLGNCKKAENAVSAIGSITPEQRKILDTRLKRKYGRRLTEGQRDELINNCCKVGKKMTNQEKIKTIQTAYEFV
jgi:hypothetical protein